MVLFEDCSMLTNATFCSLKKNIFFNYYSATIGGSSNSGSKDGSEENDSLSLRNPFLVTDSGIFLNCTTSPVNQRISVKIWIPQNAV
jgi:hypothetical protein